MPKAKVNGIDIFYEIEGEGEPLVLLAGYTCDLSLWVWVKTYLAKHFQLILVDNRGVGKSGIAGGPYSAEQMANDTQQLIQQIGYTKVHVVGHSMGSSITQVMARKYSQLINKIVLVNTYVKTRPVSSLAMLNLINMRIDGVSIKKRAQSAMPWVCSNEYVSDPKNVEAYVNSAQTYNQKLDGQIGQFEAVSAFDSSKWAQLIKVPTLIIAGEEDILTPIEESIRLNKMIKDSQLIIMPKQAHLIPIERPKELAHHIIHFL
jgi:pimeloyl-ACP methyl ester carboxylesterase